MTSPRTRIVVDAMNVIGTRPDGWWRDRDGAARALVERLRRFAAATGCDATAVLDGRPLPDVPEGDHRGVRVLYGAPSGRNAADDRIVALVGADPDPAAVVVVTADRALIARVEAYGASARSPSAFRRELDEVVQPPGGH
jgi:predicted RNA-binding protein with PIN domain